MYSQKKNIKYTLDTSFWATVSVVRFQPEFNFLHHSPQKKDNQLYREYKYLIGQQPTAQNFELYYSLACALWELGQLKEAEKMFLTILNSVEKFYTSNYYHNSDISGDTVKSVYGYGSFTSNYKNYATIYLTKINLEQKDYAQALRFLDEAVRKYIVNYNCGSGFRRQQDEYDFLYASCYEGLNRHSDVIDLLLPSCLNRNDMIVVSAIRNIYSESQIQEYLQMAEASIECASDNFPSVAYHTIYGSKGINRTDTILYYSAAARITLFEKQITMPSLNIADGGLVTKEQYLEFFRDSDFYRRLKKGN